MPKRKYSDEYKREAVALTMEPGVTQAKIAQDLVGASPVPSAATAHVRECETDGARTNMRLMTETITYRTPSLYPAVRGKDVTLPPRSREVEEFAHQRLRG